MKVKNNCKVGMATCPRLEKRTGNDPTKYYYRCSRIDRELKTVVNCEFASNPERWEELYPIKPLKTKGELTMAEKMKQTLIELKQKTSDLLEAEWPNVVKAYENHNYNLSAGIKITLDGASTNVVSIVTVLSFYPFPKTEIKTDKITVDEKQQKLFEHGD